MSGIPKESIEQANLANWLDLNGYTFSAIRNESDTRSFFKGKQRKISGCRKGIPDFVILLKRKSILFIELKRQRKVLKSGKLGASPSVVSDEQMKWNKELNEIENVSSVICYGFTEALETIVNYERL